MHIVQCILYIAYCTMLLYIVFLQDYNGVALVNYYTDGTNENYGNQVVKYYSFANETDVELVPMIDVCYKEVPVEECEHPYEPVSVT